MTLSEIGHAFGRKLKAWGTKRETPFYWMKACHGLRDNNNKKKRLDIYIEHNTRTVAISQSLSGCGSWPSDSVVPLSRIFTAHISLQLQLFGYPTLTLCPTSFLFRFSSTFFINYFNTDLGRMYNQSVIYEKTLDIDNNTQEKK